MTQATLQTQRIPTRDPKRYSLRPIFLNWPVAEPGLEQSDLFDAQDLQSYDLIFFDPYRFAIDHRLWKDSVDLSEGQYVSVAEQGIVKYLSEARKATKQIQAALAEGSTLIVRCRIPNSHLSVRKRSSVGTQSYTSSVISTFFWLEQIIGKYSLRSSVAQNLRYRDTRHAFKKVMGDCAVICRQTQDSLSLGCQRVVATAGNGDQAAITKVTYDEVPGSVYFVPEFQTSHESDKLIEALIKDREAPTGDDTERPQWMNQFDGEINRLIQLKFGTDKIDDQITVLEKQRSVILKQQQSVRQIADLLFDRGTDFASAVMAAARTLGLEVPNIQPGDGIGEVQCGLKGDRTSQVYLCYHATADRSINILDLDVVLSSVASHQLEVVPKILLVFNPHAPVAPQKRTDWITNEVVAAARKNNICLLPSYELFVAAHYLLGRWDSETIQSITFSLRRDMLECDGLFQLNRIKYGMDVPPLPALEKLHASPPPLIAPGDSDETTV